MTRKKEQIILLMKNAQEEFADKFDLVVVPEIFSKQVLAYGAMSYDLELILQYVEKLKIKNDNLQTSALTYSMISLYGKCFTDASKESYPKLEPNDIFKGQNNFREIHDYLMNLRHQFLAHRGKTDDEVGMVYIAVLKEDRTKAKLKYGQLKLTAFSKERLNEFDKHFKFVKGVIDKKFEKAGNKVYDGMLKKFNAKELAQFTFTNIKE